MKKDLLQITIDGPASSGKSTVALLVAKKLNIEYISTGKIFRSYALALKDIDIKDQKLVCSQLNNIDLVYKDSKFILNGKDVTSLLTSNTLSMPASIISAYPEVRSKYIVDIRKIIESTSIILDGRDIGTVVLPSAKYKFYLDARPTVRATRRALEIGVKLNSVEFNQLLEEIKQRDHNDKTRTNAPLSVPKNACVIDSSDMTAEEVANFIIDKVKGAK